MVVVVVEMKEELVVVGVLVKKRKMKEKGEGRIYKGFGFVKVMQIR